MLQYVCASGRLVVCSNQKRFATVVYMEQDAAISFQNFFHEMKSPNEPCNINDETACLNCVRIYPWRT